MEGEFSGFDGLVLGIVLLSSVAGISMRMSTQSFW